jgi:hypothetical protein
MHARTHVSEVHRSPAGLMARTEYADGMIEHDATIGAILKKPDDLGIANDTIAVYNDRQRAASEHLARRRSAARRTPTGKALSACRR